MGSSKPEICIFPVGFPELVSKAQTRMRLSQV